MKSIVVLNGSARKNGNTEQLAALVTKDLDASVIHLADLNIKPIEDKRHTEEGFTPVDDDYNDVIQQVLKADILIFSTPVYWYGMSTAMKTFVDRWSQSLRVPNLFFKEEMSKKEAYVVTCGGDQPKIKALPLVQQFKYTLDFVGTALTDYIIGEGNQPGDVLNDKAACQKAAMINQQLRSFK
ncbi:flavodoxin family protein [Priestia koreensis]|uniref:flavodoxin family protein n=1 Tax=Priestia koreensis TaxID=284581 RepID=UPI001F55D8B2|nr:flavodoxin family protein [Priestia koreensis]UNL84551.1 flavodoxin family protein [Priestia koreensis]